MLPDAGVHQCLVPAGEVGAHVYQMLQAHARCAQALLHMVPHQVALALEVVGNRRIDGFGNLPADLDPAKPRPHLERVCVAPDGRGNSLRIDRSMHGSGKV